MQNTLDTVRGGAEHSTEAAEKITAIRQSMNDVVAKIEEIALSTKEQLSATTSMAQAAEKIDPSANAFEGNPNLNFEHWGEYWRKVHGVRFIHVEEADDYSLEKLVRYDQLHRLAAGPTHTDTPPYRAPADARGKLWPTVIGHIEPYRRPRWDGIAYLNFASAEDIAAVLGNERVRRKILPEDLTIDQHARS